MLIYRVEDSAGRGPYIGQPEPVDCRSSKALSRHSNSLTHPAPYSDGISISQGEYCGFESMDKLRRWFWGDIEWLRKKKFHVSIYRIDEGHVKIGMKQVVFNRKRAELVSTIDFMGHEM